MPPPPRPEVLLPDPGCLGAYFRNLTTGAFAPFRCRGWACPICGPRKARDTVEAIAQASRKVGLSKMFTLTLPGRGDPRRGDPHASRRSALALWNSARVQLRRLGLAQHYIQEPEAQRDGTCHLHTGTDDGREAIRAAADKLGRKWSEDEEDYQVERRVLRAIWTRLGGGFVHVSQKPNATPEDVAAYLSKYLTKAAGEDLPWEGRRRCLENGRTRRVPFRRYTSDRRTGSLIREALLRSSRGADCEDGEDPHVWDVVRPWTLDLEGQALDWVPLRAPSSPVIEGCPTHLPSNLRAGGCCHLGVCSCFPREEGIPGSHVYRGMWTDHYRRLAEARGAARPEAIFKEGSGGSSPQVGSGRVLVANDGGEAVPLRPPTHKKRGCLGRSDLSDGLRGPGKATLLSAARTEGRATPERVVLWVRYLDHATFECSGHAHGPVVCEAVGFLDAEDEETYRLVWLVEAEGDPPTRSGLVILKGVVLKARVLAGPEHEDRVRCRVCGLSRVLPHREAHALARRHQEGRCGPRGGKARAYVFHYRSEPIESAPPPGAFRPGTGGGGDIMKEDEARVAVDLMDALVESVKALKLGIEVEDVEVDLEDGTATLDFSVSEPGDEEEDEGEAENEEEE